MKKINKSIKLFDIFALLLVVLGVIIAVSFIFQKQSYVRVTLKITNRDVLYDGKTPPSWWAYFFREGMVEKDSLGRVVAEVNDVHAYDSLNQNDSKLVFLDVTLKTNSNKRSGKHFFKGRPILVGAPIVVEFNNVYFEGLVTKTELSPDTYKQKDIVVKTKIINHRQDFPNSTGEMQHIADALHVGDQMTDINGEPIVTILEKKILPSKIESVDRYGNILLKNDLILKDIYLTLKIHVSEINGEYYLLDEKRIKIGRRVPVILQQISIWPEIIEFVVD